MIRKSEFFASHFLSFFFLLFYFFAAMLKWSLKLLSCRTNTSLRVYATRHYNHEYRIDEFRMLWLPWATHRKVWHKMAVWTATQRGWPSKLPFCAILFYASPRATKACETRLYDSQISRCRWERSSAEKCQVVILKKKSQMCHAAFGRQGRQGTHSKVDWHFATAWFFVTKKP